MKNPSPNQKQLAEKIVTATSKLIAEGGISAATVRAISEKVGASAPQIYRLFFDIHELYMQAAFVLLNEQIALEREPDDPVKALYNMIETLITFGLRHPELYLHLSNPRGPRKLIFWKAQSDILEAKIQSVATAGRLRVDEADALAVILPLCGGFILSSIQRTSSPTTASWFAMQLARPLLRNDPLEVNYPGEPSALAAALAVKLKEVDVLTPGEEAIMKELLARLASA